MQPCQEPSRHSCWMTEVLDLWDSPFKCDHPRLACSQAANWLSLALRPADPPAAPLAMEEGEIVDGLAGSPPVRDLAAETEQRVFAGVNLAALEALSGRTAAALAACKRAMAAAEGMQPSC